MSFWFDQMKFIPLSSVFFRRGRGFRLLERSEEATLGSIAFEATSNNAFREVKTNYLLWIKKEKQTIKSYRIVVADYDNVLCWTYFCNVRNFRSALKHFVKIFFLNQSSKLQNEVVTCYKQENAFCDENKIIFLFINKEIDWTDHFCMTFQFILSMFKEILNRNTKRLYVWDCEIVRLCDFVIVWKSSKSERSCEWMKEEEWRTLWISGHWNGR